MGRKRIGIPQRKFDFAITPKTDQDWEVVNRLEELKATNKLSEFLRSIVYDSVLTAIKPDESTMGQNEARTGIVEHDTPKPVDKPVRLPVVPTMPVSGWQGKSAPKPASNGKRHSKGNSAEE